MAIEVDITGSGSFAGHKSNIASYSYSEGSTPVLPGDSSGGVGDVSFSVVDEADTILLYRDTLLLTDGGFGSIAGVIDSVSATDGVAEITGRSKLGRLTVPGTIVAQQTTLGAAFTTILSLVGITTGIQIDSSLTARPIFLPGFTGDLWVFVKDLCIAENVEVSLLSDTVVVRPLRTRTLNTGNLESQSWAVSDQELAQQVEVAYYNYTVANNLMFYPKGGWTKEVQPYQVGADETLVVDLPVDGFLTSIQQPTPQLSVARGYTGPNSVYTIAGNDGLPVPVAQWVNNGGSVTVALKDNGATIEATIVGASIPNLAPFRLAVTAGPSDVYSTLRLVGSGIAFNRQTIVRSTGLTLAETPNVEAPIIDNVSVSSLTQAVDVAARAASRYGMPGRTYSASARQINRPNAENSNVVYPTFAQWASTLTPGLLFSGFNAANAGVTFQAFTNAQFATVANNLTNQAFGNIGGSRTQYREAMYRVRSATSTAESVSFDAEPDTLFSDFADISSARTFTNIGVDFAGLTFTDFNLVPLRR
jgi:hypothetical protein